MIQKPTRVESLDLARHAVIEASAGTGKTYTIEQLVYRLLTEQALSLDQILVVTYTEKATGELKTRLRRMIETQLKSAGQNAAVLNRAYDQFDQAPIFTIHGFCQRLAQEFSLAQNQEFRPVLVSDPDLMAALLREVQRKTWRATFGTRLRAVLENAGYTRDAAWDERVLTIAGRFRERSAHRLRPDFVPDWWQRLDEPGSDWTGQLELFTINALHQQLRAYKRQRGLRSFDDMITCVDECLDPATNPGAERLLAEIRDRFRCGIVDEFQDTDPCQWNIFRNLFLVGGSSRLFIVGDPKQAIFGFRGADLPTYTQAVEHMQQQNNAVVYPLAENWRTVQPLLDGLNRLFGVGAWFPPSEKIRYHDVHAPSPDVAPTRITADDSGRSALNLVDLTNYETLRFARRHYARFVVHEIDHLLHGADGQPLVTFASNKTGGPRPLHAGDIAVLVMRRSEAAPLVEGFERAGIPYSFYKQQGLWQTDEALHLATLLETLEQPDDLSSLRKALLTGFFHVDPEDLARADEVPAQHPARALFQNWIAFAEERKWSSLCQSLLEDTGLLYRSALSIEDRSEHSLNVSILEHLLATLEQTAHGMNLDLPGVLGWMRHLRRQRDLGDDDLQPVDASDSTVKLMTIHSCKGLEFPIVFLAGGFTKSTTLKPDERKWRDDAGRLVFELNEMDQETTQRVRAERRSEQRRLLYVAMTRAMLKLYVPQILITPKNQQYAGPLGEILEPALERSHPERLGNPIAQVIPAIVPKGTRRPAQIKREVKLLSITGPLFPPLDSTIGKRRIVVRSFSSMARHHLAAIEEGASFGEPKQLPDEAPTPVDGDDPLRGPVFGDMVHKVLEKVDFADVQKAATPDTLWRAPKTQRLLDSAILPRLAELSTRTPAESLHEAARRQIAQLVWQALRTPLSILGCSLCEIPRSDRLHEIEFLFPEGAGDAEPGREERFITGFMDLLFRKDGKYYLLDWKTNLLLGYAREHLEQSMAESDYHRQYRLYLHATARWLQGGRLNSEERIGGVFYLYVRGMNGRDDSAGVFFRRPTQHDLDLAAILSE